MEKRTIIAMVISAIFIFAWFNLTEKEQTQKKNNITTNTQAVEKLQSSQPIEMRQVNTTETGTAKRIDITEKYILENQDYKITIDANGGKLESCILKEENKKDIELILKETVKQGKITSKNLLITANNKPVILNKQTENKDPFTLQGKIGKDVKIKEMWSFTATKGLINLDIVLENTSNDYITISNFEIGLGPGLNTDRLGKNNAKILRSLAWNGEKLYKKIKPTIISENIRWIGINSQYFLASIIDTDDFFNTIKVTEKKIPELKYTKDISLNPKETIKINIMTYWGLKKYDLLKTIGFNLEKACGVSFLGKGILYVLNGFYNLTNNYGISIILLTTLLQLVMFPLTRKSYKSMHAMKMLQPQLADLRIKYKDDAQRLNAEIMNLYKTKKVNPLGGCLPMIFQLPIFWALFSTLRNATELRYAPFMFWIKDLSRPDTIMSLGNIPINILPLLMGVSMFLQQKFNATSSDPTQKNMMIFMPILFTFMFWGFPSGLVLYWFVSSIYTFSLQIWIGKKMEAK